MSHLQCFTFTLKHEVSTQNKEVDDLSTRVSLVTVMRAEILECDTFKELYMNDEYFGPVMQAAVAGECNDYSIKEGFLFKGSQLCL